MHNRPNISPGEVLLEEFLKPAGMTSLRLARNLNIKVERIADILSGRKAICVDTALRLSHYFGTSDRFWLDLQISYDLEKARRSACHIRSEITPLVSAA